MLQLKDICVIDWGNTSLTKKAYEVDGAYLAVSATGADGKISHYEHEADVCVLSAIGAQCGKMFFPQQRFTAIKNTITLTPNRELVDSKYLYYLFTHIELPKRGAAQPFISKGDIEKFELPHLPPLAEQQRIVAKLDAAFAEIDRAVEACESEIEQSNHLFDSLVFERFTKSDDDGEAVALKELTKELLTGPFGSALHKSDYVDDGVAVINPQNLIGGEIVPSDGKFITEKKFEELKRYQLEENDIVIARRGEMGRCALVKASKQRMICGTGCMILRVNDDCSAEFVAELIKSNYVRSALEKGAIGATMLNLNQGILLGVKVQAKTIQQQRQNTSYIAQARKVVNDYKGFKSLKSAKLEALKSAILAQELQPPQSEAA
jgi:type I restriction enzyme S subunit